MMVVKNQSEERTPFNTLPPSVSRNETYMSDAVSSLLANFQRSAKKKQEIPRHPGGIWDIDDEMEVTESCATKTQPIDRNYFRQQLNMLTRSEKCDGVAMETEEVMGSKELYSSNRSPLLPTPFPKEECISKELGGRDNKAFEEVNTSTSSKNQFEKLKKKNSEDFFVERSKRCRTGSITEVNPPLSASIDQEETEIDMATTSVENLSTLAPEVKVSGLPKYLSVQFQEQSDSMSKKNNSCIGSVKESHTNSDAKVELVESSVKGYLYQSAIDTLRKVTSRLENWGTVDPPENAVSYSEVIEDLQRICRIFKQLESSKFCRTTDKNSEVPVKDASVLDTYSEEKDIEAGEAVTFLNENQCVDSKCIQYSRRDIGSILKESSEYVEFLDGSKKGKDNVHEDRIFYNKVPFWKKHNKKSDPLSKSKQVDGSKVLSGRSSNTENNQDNLMMEKLMTGTLPFKPNGNPPPFKVASEQIANDGTQSGRIKGPVPPLKAVDSASQLTSKDASVEPKAIDTTLPSKVKDISSPLKAVDADSESSDKSPQMEPNLTMEKIMNGTLPWKPSGSPPPVAAFSGTQISNDRKLPAVTTSPSRAVNATLQFDAMETSENIFTMDITPSSSDWHAGLSSTNAIPAPKPLGTNTVSEEIMKEDLPSGSGLSPRDAEVQTANAGKLNEMIPASSSTSSDMDTVTSNAMISVPQKITRIVYPPKSLAMQIAVNVLNTTSPLMTTKETSPNAESYKTKEHYARQGSLSPPTVSPTKYVAPQKRNSNETQVGKSYEKSPQSGRPILPWRSDGGSPRKLTEQSQGGKTSAVVSRRSGSGFATGGSSKNVPNCQNWRKSPPPRFIQSQRNYFNPAKVPDHVIKKEISKPIERNEIHSKKEEQVLNVSKPDNSVSGSKPYEDRNAMISLKVFNEDNALVVELPVMNNDLIQLKRKVPKLSEIVPSADEPDKLLGLNADAVKVFLSCVFSVPYILSGWEIALETYALAKKFPIKKLQEECKKIFNSKPINPRQVHNIVLLARKLQITEVLKTSVMFSDVPASEIPAATEQVTAKAPQCVISCTTFVEPSEFLISLSYMKEKGLGSTRSYDIQNDIVFAAKSGSFWITGFQIKLAVESKDLGVCKTIYCDVYKSQQSIFSVEREKPMNSMMIINFNQKLLVRAKEEITMSILIEDLCLRLCHCILKEKEVGRCSTGSFEATFKSDKKTEAKQSLFFVEKLFYTYEGQNN